jgi:predicted hotdog family 3-hydroxylacyl-ACP dehydratase
MSRLGMNPYLTIASRIGVADSMSLVQRLVEWHDAMVTHERRVGAGRQPSCDDECPHAHARELWREAVNLFGPQAKELTFLHSRATMTRKAA